VTAASIAKEGVGLDSVQRLDSVVDRSELPSFVELMKVVFLRPMARVYPHGNQIPGTFHPRTKQQ
jgi:hypothetical protein